MARMIWASGFLHIAVIAGLIGLNTWLPAPASSLDQQVYRVDLVTLNERSPVQRPPAVDEAYEVVSKKEAAAPQEEAALALERTPRLVSEEPDPAPEAPQTFETDSPEIRLDERNFEYPYYLGMMQRKIQQHFTVPRMLGVTQLETVIYFRVVRSGRITGVVMERSSSNAVFDLAAQRALNAADPLPPLPEGYRKSYLGVHFAFQYAL
ncbi:MAG: TonB C-terminal domain-containing protein [Gemmatimonadetes bacterium]|nr:TonB C-terminal domain-containing protein [Gemmatimonadota bacterium]MYD27207.1 TonB C-terminal domain-containing protein [Gemmatimonadota bacterium]MYI99352.1 TonB C-terminal domain-containing protein [Gemmatimonadota bacterium]